MRVRVKQYLVSRQLSALARLGALSHLDLQFISVRQIGTGHAKTTRRHLLAYTQTDIVTYRLTHRLTVIVTGRQAD